MSSRLLKAYATLMTVTTTLLLLVSTYSLHFADGKKSFDEIEVERINVVEPDGTLKLVMSNSHRQAEGTIKGEEIPLDRTREAGMIFFNDVGDEIGGLIFGGNREEAGSGFMLDQSGQDQVIGLRNMEWTDEQERRVRQSGLEFWDRPKDVTILECITMRQQAEKIEDTEERERTLDEVADVCGGASRAFVGRTAAGHARINLRDGHGDVRLRLTVEEDGGASIEFLDSEGSVGRAIGMDNE